jgi:hypothetical protein
MRGYVVGLRPRISPAQRLHCFSSLLEGSSAIKCCATSCAWSSGATGTTGSPGSIQSQTDLAPKSVWREFFWRSVDRGEKKPGAHAYRAGQAVGVRLRQQARVPQLPQRLCVQPGEVAGLVDAPSADQVPDRI